MEDPDVQLSPQMFRELSRAVNALCGLVITEEKEYLIRDRLGTLVEQRHLQSFEELSRQLQSGTNQQLAEAVIDAITTRETFFFRDPQVFESLRQHVFPLLDGSDQPPQRPIRIWSAGSSNGQEAYSLAMLAEEYAVGRKLAGTPFSILASDISQSAVHFARKGSYDAREIARGVSSSRIAQFFQKKDNRFEAIPTIKKLVEVRHLNLCHPFVGLGTFDLICCRNVLIYFDLQTRQQICQRFFNSLNDRGWLLLGSAENLYGLSTGFESVRLGESLFYRKTEPRLPPLK